MKVSPPLPHVLPFLTGPTFYEVWGVRAFVSPVVGGYIFALFILSECNLDLLYRAWLFSLGKMISSLPFEHDFLFSPLSLLFPLSRVNLVVISIIRYDTAVQLGVEPSPLDIFLHFPDVRPSCP